MCFALLVLLAGTSPVRAAGNPDWLVRVSQPNDAQPNTLITGIVQTRDGYLWVGGTSGLYRFDGDKFEQVDLTSYRPDKNQRVGAIAPTSDGSLIIALYNGPVIRFYLNQPPVVIRDFPSFTPSSILEDFHGDIWLSSREGAIWRIAAGKLTQVRAVKETSRAVGFCFLMQDSDGHIWYVHDDDVGVFREDHFEPFGRFPLSPNSRAGSNIARAKYGGVWIASDFKLYHCDQSGKMESVGSFRPEHAAGVVSSLREDRDGAVWIGTSGHGLHRYANGTFEAIPASHERITAITQDNEGNMWIGTQGGGLNCVQPAAIRLEGSTTGLASDSVVSLCEDSDGVIWAAMQDGSLKRRVNDQWETTSPATLGGDGATCLTVDQRGVMWIGTRNRHLYLVEHGNVQLWSMTGQLATHTVSVMLPAKNGDLWLGREGPDQLQRIHGQEITTMDWAGHEDHFRCIAEDTDGSLWIGTRFGKLIHVQNDKLIDCTHLFKRATGGISCLYPARDGTIWIGTGRAGVARLKNGAITSISTAQGLFSNTVVQIIDDQRGWIWFGAMKGVFKVREQDLEDLADGKVARVQSIHYGDDAGVPALQASSSRSASALRTRDGRLWMLVGTALVTISPERVRDNLQPPPVLIDQFRADDKILASYGGHVPSIGAELSDAQNQPPLELAPGHHHLRFDYTALSFSAPGNVRFQYQLQGYDDHWLDGGPERSVSYANLPAGNYRFVVKACNGDGVWNETGAAMAFTVVPSVWQTWWFRLPAAAAFTAVIVAIARYVSFRRLRSRLAILEHQTAVDRERTRIARDLHDELGTGLTNVALLGDMTLRHQDDAGRVRENAQQITSTVRQIMRSLDETVWAVHPRNDTLEHLLNYLGKFAVEFLETADIACRVSIVEGAPEIGVTADVRHNVLLVVKEALNNIVRHARATEVRFHTTIEADAISITIEDNGQGFENAPQDALADGLRNMRQRMEDIGGQFAVQSTRNVGTKINLRFGWRKT